MRRNWSKLIGQAFIILVGVGGTNSVLLASWAAGEAVVTDNLSALDWRGIRHVKAPIYPLTRSLTHLLTHSLTHSLTHTFSHPLARSLTMLPL